MTSNSIPCCARMCRSVCSTRSPSSRAAKMIVHRGSGLPRFQSVGSPGSRRAHFTQSIARIVKMLKQIAAQKKITVRATIGSSEQPGYDLTVHIGQSKIPALKMKDELFVIETKQMQHGGMNVMHVCGIFGAVETEFFRLAQDESSLHAAARHPHCECVDVMVTPSGIAVLPHRRPAKFPAPNDQSILQ